MEIRPADWLHVVMDHWQLRLVWDPMDAMDYALTWQEPTAEQIRAFDIPAPKMHVFFHRVTFDPHELN